MHVQRALTTLVLCINYLSLSCSQALVFDDKKFQYILRILNTNVDGKQKVMYALTKIKGIGRRFANLVCKKADIDMNKRYAECCNSYYK